MPLGFSSAEDLGASNVSDEAADQPSASDSKRSRLRFIQRALTLMFIMTDFQAKRVAPLIASKKVRFTDN
jgi:hypothetical protein